MKPVLLSATLFIFASAAMAQEKNPEGITSGRITYEEKIKIEIKLEGDAAQFDGILPRERKSEKLLTFITAAALFEDGPDTEEDMVSYADEGPVRIKMVVSGANKIYTDLKTEKVTEQRDFMNRIFLVETRMPESTWKITGNQKVILGFPCVEAVKLDTAGNKTIAWFTPSINIKSGPAGLCNLPGMILEADINGGSRTYVAKTIEPVEASGLKLQKPKEGKTVTEDEYKAIVAEKMKEMGVEPGVGGRSHMQIVIKKQ